MEIIFPKVDISYLDSMLVSNQPIKPFSKDLIDPIKKLSQIILQDNTNKNKPDLMMFGFWLRDQIASFNPQYLERRPRGIVFHIPPANVEIMFMYSWALGFLGGNLNVVRLSSRYKNLEGVFFEYLKNLNQTFPVLEKRNLFLKYSHDQVDITKKISQISSARMIWGGDKTIQNIRSIESNVFCRDVVFSDRFSGAVFKADSILNLEHKALEDLITKFFQDTMEFDQMGCSSPRFISWVFNDEKNLKFAKEKFWQSFKDHAQKKFQDQPSFAIDRLSTQINLIANDQSKDLSYDFPTRVNVLKLNNFLRQEHCGKCLFYEIDLKNLNDLCDQLTPKDQTLVQFGFNDEELKNFTSSLGWSSLNRVVMVGEALKFSHIWDGYDIYNELTTFNPI